MSGPRDARTVRPRDLAALAAVAARLGVDEIELLCLLARRLRTGQRRYGRLALDGDRRDFRREALEEVADGLAYSAIALMREGRPGPSSRSSEDRAPAPSGDDLRGAADTLRAVLPAPEGPQENGLRLATLRRGEDQELHVTWLEWKDRLHLGLRVWRRNRHGLWFPDRHRGVLVHLDELAEFVEAVAAAADLARANLVAHPAPPTVPGAPAAPEAGPATAVPTRRGRRR